MRKQSILLGLLLLTAFSNGVFAQSNANNQALKEQINGGFQRNSPDVGEPLPDLRAYDAAGKELQLGQLKGDYTVLVFGCLT